MTKRETNIAKGIAILLMFFHHLFSSTARINNYELTGLICNSKTTAYVANQLKVCVAMFALISGYGLYVVTRKAEEENQKLAFKWFAGETAKRYWRMIRDIWVILPLMMILSVLFHFSRVPSTVWKNGGVIKEIKGFFANMTGLAGILGYKWFVKSWWYLGIAVIFIFVFPIIYWLMRHLWSVIPLIIVCVIPFVFKVKAHHDNIWRYLPAFVLGMFLADINLFGKLTNWLKQSVAKHIFVGVFIPMLFWLTLYFNSMLSKHFIFHSIEATLIVMAAIIFVVKIPILNTSLEIIGRNSKYMWLVHVFIYGQIFGEKLFLFKNIWLIWIVLLLISLLASIVLKKFTDAIYNGIAETLGKIKSLTELKAD